MNTPSLAERLPWHREIWSRLQAAHKSGRLPHALLYCGPAGLGKRRLATNFAHSLLCESPADEGTPCGSCRGCHLFQVGTHPDFKILGPDEPGKPIRVDTIRDFIDKGALTAQAGGYKVVIIDPADAMNMAAANSLLKTLEEPVSWTLIILITDRLSRLPATIRSRCQRILFSTPRRSDAAQWLGEQIEQGDPELLLGLSSGAPLNALALADTETLQERGRMFEEFCGMREGGRDPVEIAARWETLELGWVLNWTGSWLIDMLRLKTTDRPVRLFNPDYRQRLQTLAQRLEFKELCRLLDRVYESNRTRHSQLNSLMTLEGLLLAWANSGKVASPR